MKLVIVESPAKARTIEKFLGKDYRVEASYGHIRDLPSSAAEVPPAQRKEGWAKLGVDTEHNFTPLYIVPKDSQKRVAELKKVVSKADEVLLATDEDREGESISWHLLEVLKPALEKTKAPVHRIAFHEITRSAIREALENPRQVDDQLVRAQETRRILDRLYGYSLSPVLWKKVRTKLSAGRVQSVALRLVVEREEERQRFQSTEYWDVVAQLHAKGSDFAATLQAIADRRLAAGRDFDPTTGALDPEAHAVVLGEPEARRIAEAVTKHPWRVSRIEKKEVRQRPMAPFTTSTMQQAASSRLHMSPKQTMSVAQRLYEGIDLGGGEREGLITYMRTDSVNLADKALHDAAGFIRSRWGASYHQEHRYKTKSKMAQEAHEAIRPTEIARTPEQVKAFLSREELLLYTLVWQRTVASQMADAVLDRTTVDLTVDVDRTPHLFRANGSILRFPGFTQVWGGEREDTLLPPLADGEVLAPATEGRGRPLPLEGQGDGGTGVELNTGEGVGRGVAARSARGGGVAGATPERHETRPPGRYTEATLIKKLEEEGIGRPSTYTPTLSTIQDRGYVLKKGEALVPTYVGMAVIHLLREHFPQYVDVKFTARMEDDLDEIARGETDWVDFLSRFYWGESAEEAAHDAHRKGLVQRIDEALPRIEYPAIHVGNDPETGQPITVRIGRNSVYVQRGEGGEADESGKRGDRATIPVDLLIDELTPEKVAELLQHRTRGEEPLGQQPDSGENVYVRIGPYGPYVQLGEGAEGEKPKRVSLPPGTKPQDVDLALALRLLSLPRTLGVDPSNGKEIVAGIGRFGPYVQRAWQFKNVKTLDELFAMTLDEALRRLAQTGQTVLKELGPNPDSGGELRILAGRFGPYLTDGKLNASLRKGDDPEAMTLQEAVALLGERGKPPGSGKPRRGRSAAAKGGSGASTIKAAAKTRSAEKKPARRSPSAKAKG
ncbi:MAG TPA: type I DNA topoisomerase [Thermoanaerobaculia bacterium]|nr:type I DNA topoisomerase [Thermoanaerobaculia bacterium]